MSAETYLQSLRSKRALLEQVISEETQRPAPDEAVLARLKREVACTSADISFLERRAKAERSLVSQTTDVLVAEESPSLSSIEEALDELERLSSQALDAAREEVEEARRQSRELERILAALRSTLRAVDQEWHVSAAAG
jgi:hypothetical protein